LSPPDFEFAAGRIKNKGCNLYAIYGADMLFDALIIAYSLIYGKAFIPGA
jgi:hypothetical protein